MLPYLVVMFIRGKKKRKKEVRGVSFINNKIYEPIGGWISATSQMTLKHPLTMGKLHVDHRLVGKVRHSLKRNDLTLTQTTTTPICSKQESNHINSTRDYVTFYILLLAFYDVRKSQKERFYSTLAHRKTIVKYSLIINGLKLIIVFSLSLSSVSEY